MSGKMYFYLHEARTSVKVLATHFGECTRRMVNAGILSPTWNEFPAHDHRSPWTGLGSRIDGLRLYCTYDEFWRAMAEVEQPAAMQSIDNTTISEEQFNG